MCSEMKKWDHEQAMSFLAMIKAGDPAKLGAEKLLEWGQKSPDAVRAVPNMYRNDNSPQFQVHLLTGMERIYLPSAADCVVLCLFVVYCT